MVLDVFGKQSTVRKMAGVIGARKFCAKFVFLAVFIAIFASINIQTVKAVELPELTKKQLRYQNEQLRKLLSNNKPNNNKDSEQIAYTNIKCADIFKYIIDNNELKLPEFDYIATNRVEELKAIEYINNNFDFQKLIQTTDNKLHVENSHGMLVPPAPTILEYLSGNLGYIPLFDEDVQIAKDHRQVWIKKNKINQYFWVFMIRPDSYEINTIFSLDTKFVNNDGFISHGHEYETIDNYNNAPEEFTSHYSDMEKFHATIQEKKRISAYFIRSADRFPSVHIGIFEVNGQLVIWKLIEDHSFVNYLHYDYNNEGKLLDEKNKPIKYIEYNLNFYVESGIGYQPYGQFCTLIY